MYHIVLSSTTIDCRCSVGNREEMLIFLFLLFADSAAADTTQPAAASDPSVQRPLRTATSRFSFTLGKASSVKVEAVAPAVESRRRSFTGE